MKLEEHVRDEQSVPTPVLCWRIDGSVLSVIGEVDVATVGMFGAALAICDDDATVAALDLSRVAFFSAAGVRCFIAHGWTTRAHPMIIASPVVRRVLGVCDVDFLLEPHGWVGGSVRLTCTV